MIRPRPSAEQWIEPRTHLAYPLSFSAYRRTREAQEKSPPRHRGLGPEIDRSIWRRWQRPPVEIVDVVLTFRPGTSPRVQRIVGEVLRAIRRGQRAPDAIHHVAKRFGLGHAKGRAFISAGLRFEMLPRHEAAAPGGSDASSNNLISD